MKTIKRKYLFIAAAIISALCVLLAACGGSQTEQNEALPTESADPHSEAQEQTTAERLYPELEPQDFGGYDFRFLTRSLSSNPDWVGLDHRDLTAEKENGDIINDAVYIRNKKIEDKYNISISETVTGDFVGDVRKLTKAGDDVYDAVFPHINEFAALAQEGNLIDLFSVPCLDLAKPWWNQGCARDLSIIHKLFVVQGDLLVLDNDAMEVMIFSKTLIKENSLESPYEIVKRGEWTIDKLIEMSSTVSKDQNGDGKMYIKDDLFGCIVVAGSSSSFMVAAGEKVAAKDENDYPVITFGSERCYRICDAISRLMLNEDNVVHLHRYEGQFPIYEEQVKMFSENRALFSWIRMRIVESLRAMETDFGIIPLPKLDAQQKDYITNNNPINGAGISIPATAQNLERTGMIIEDLCAESRYTLQPAYYELNLRGKFVRDDESQEMLEIILNNTAYDIGYIYNFGGFQDVILHYGQTFKTDYASAFEKYRDKMQKDIDKVIEIYEKLD
ncbi:MAG: hypothetical protein FWH48_05525 [Oscillospiraceae bacterium]|nr:hypothetical protein [Oscillospiraceae bacterium]